MKSLTTGVTRKINPRPLSERPSVWLRSVRGTFYASSVLFALLAPIRSHAVVLDWNTVTWTPGATSQSFDIDPTNPGADIRITVANVDGSAFTNGNPVISTLFTGGADLTKDTLNLRIDLSNTSAFVRVEVDFLYAGGVNNAKFSLYDVDRDVGNTWQDQVRYFSGTSISDSTIMPTSVTGSSGNTVTGNSTTGFTATGTANIVNTGAGSENSTVNIQYGQSYIKSMFFDYGSTSTVQSDPNGQGIGFANLSFTPAPTPEFNPSTGAVLGCVGAFLLRRRRHSPAGKSEMPNHLAA